MPMTQEQFELQSGDEAEDDKKLYVQFFMEAVKDESKSAIAGRPIFNEIPHIRIMTPGSTDVTVSRVLQRHKDRFPDRWAKFVRQQEEVPTGTPLSQVTFLTVGQVAELKAINVLTLEHLANLSDTHVSKLMGMNTLRQKARDFLKAAAEAAPITKLQAELEARDSQIAMLTNQVQELGRIIEKMQADKG